MYPPRYFWSSGLPLGSFSPSEFKGVVHTLYGLNSVTEDVLISAPFDIAHQPAPSCIFLYQSAFCVAPSPYSPHALANAFLPTIFVHLSAFTTLGVFYEVANVISILLFPNGLLSKITGNFYFLGTRVTFIRYFFVFIIPAGLNMIYYKKNKGFFIILV